MRPGDRLLAAGCRCAECPFSKDGEPKQPVLPVGPKVPDAVLVGDVPSREDARQGEPFSGPTGQQLDDLLADAGLQRERLLLINAVACVPTEPRTAKAIRKAVSCCRPFVRQVLRALPKDIPTVLMGAAAVASVTGQTKGAAAARGFIDYEFDLSKACPDES